MVDVVGSVIADADDSGFGVVRAANHSGPRGATEPALAFADNQGVRQTVAQICQSELTIEVESSVAVRGPLVDVLRAEHADIIGAADLEQRRADIHVAELHVGEAAINRE